MLCLAPIISNTRPYHQPFLLPYSSSLIPLLEFTSPRHREPGVYVWDPREGVCGDGETTWWHAGDDPLQWERQIAWEAHQVPHHAGVYVPQQTGDFLFCTKLQYARKWQNECKAVDVAVFMSMCIKILPKTSSCHSVFVHAVCGLPIWTSVWLWLIHILFVWLGRVFMCEYRYLQLWDTCTLKTSFTVIWNRKMCCLPLLIPSLR